MRFKKKYKEYIFFNNFYAFKIIDLLYFQKYIFYKENKNNYLMVK